ncbi:MAG: TPM domain-containing protein, partial [Janthinobacterium lividum]
MPVSKVPVLRVPVLKVSVLKVLAALVLALGFGVAVAGPAVAVAPFRLGQQVTDQVGALGGDAQQVQSALEQLRADDQVQLWVAYVDSFDGESAQQWADDTALASDLGTDDVLLAVATGDRAYAYSVDTGFRLDDDQIAEVGRATENRLAKDDWAGAAVAGANSLDAQISGGGTSSATGASNGTSSGGGIGVLVGLVVLLGIIGVVVALVLRRKRRATATAEPESEFTHTSTADLTTQADTVLVRADDAVRASSEELQFATAEFGEERTAEFRTVLDSARGSLTAAFAARQSLEDDQPETEEQRRDILTRVITSCRSTGQTLDEASDGVDALRDLVGRAPQVLESLQNKLPAVRSGVGPVRAEVDRLRAEFGAPAVAAIADVPDQAEDRATLAERELATAREALTDTTRSSEVVDAVRNAETSLAQAEQLLASVTRTGADLRQAVTELPVATARLQAAAQSTVQPLPGVSSAEFASAAAAALAVVESVRTRGAADPLGSLHRVVEAERALDTARGHVEAAGRDRQDAQRALEQALGAARAEIAAAEDYVAARRGAVGGSARTHLGEAQR